MVSLAYKTCLELIEKMVKLHPNFGFMDQISNAELEKLIGKHIGMDQRTKEKYVRACVQFELLEPLVTKKDVVLVYSINLVKADHEIREVFGRQLRQIELLEPKS